ncbi:Uncharacterized protein TCM_002777 [Theobroma cacao]|uniref:Uncharacterized protein n=1 Tax=Theobroma cacao TaxID=3641 RepID=A0A061DN30_THECC|nr:Uncharacterized protein TCM_002777 [Theobroma cacao]
MHFCHSQKLSSGEGIALALVSLQRESCGAFRCSQNLARNSQVWVRNLCSEFRYSENGFSLQRETLGWLHSKPFLEFRCNEKASGN